MGVQDLIKSLGYKLGLRRYSMFGIDEMQIPPGWNYQTYLQKYGQIGWLYACVNVIAAGVASIPWHLYELDAKGGRNEIFDHELLKVFNNPNRFQTRYQFIYLATMYKKLVGEEFWQINFNGQASPKTFKYYNKQDEIVTRSGRPAEIWLAPPAYMSVIPDPTEYISHYEYKAGAMTEPIKFSVDEIIHIMTPNPYNPYRGLSEAQALTTDLDSETYAARYQQKLFFNDGTPGFVIKYPAADLPTAESRREMMEEWDERFKGFRNRGKTAFLWGGEPSAITLKNTDMDFNNLRHFSRDVILGAYRVHPSVIGVTESVNLANAEAGHYTFAMYAIEPELAALREALNKEFVPFFGDNLLLDYDNPVPEDITRKVNNTVNLYKTGIITRNEARAECEYDETQDGGDEFYSQPSPFGGSPGIGSPITPEDQNPKPAVEEGKILKVIFASENEKEEYWKGFLRRTESYEKPLIQALNGLFAGCKGQAIKAIEDNQKVKLIDTWQFKQDYIKAGMPLIGNALNDAIKNGMDLVAPKTPHKDAPIPSVLSAIAEIWLRSRMNWAADQIGESLARDLAEALAEGFTNGESIPQLADRIETFFASPARAERIARTEILTASNIGAVEGYKQAGVTKSEIFAARDERECDLCANLDGQIHDISEGYNPPFHVSCRCCLLPIISSD